MKQQKSKKIKFSINMQIAMTFLGLLILVIGVCIFLNSFFLENYYLKNKQQAFKSAYMLLNESASEASDSEELSSKIRRICDIYNINVLVMDESTDTVISSENDIKPIQMQLFEHLFGDFADIPDVDGQKPPQRDNKTLEETDTYTIQIISDVSMGDKYLEMWGVLDDGKPFLIRSAVDSITDSVSLANRFLFFVGAIAVVISALIAMWASKVISKPVSELTEISEHMRNLEFDAKYTGHAKNEIGVLGENINNLSETLEKTISELKSANNQLERDLAKRTELDDMRKEFLSNVSHELKTPIALIQGYAEGLKIGVNDDSESRDFYCDVIMDETAKMNTLVSKLLTLNQLEFGNEAVNMERFDIVDMIKTYVHSVDILIKAADAQVTITGDESVYVWTDEFRVYEVLSNYFSNALHYLDGERKIDIRITRQESNVRVSVFNTGEPIPEEAIPHLWEKFYKVDKARTREYGGSGVGLSIVKAIQDSLNQDYGVINYNNGVEFYFELGI